MLRRRSQILSLVLAAAWSMAPSCGGGGGGDGSGAGGGLECDGACTQQALSESQIHTILTNAVNEAVANGVAATIAVTDRVGNVLAVFAMDGAASDVVIGPVQKAPPTGLDGALVGGGASLAAISKAGTGAYLSSQGNAFSTRTASQIVQANFNPGENFQPGGPLFGVQFSQLPCGDLVRRFDSNMLLGPKRMPFGLSADPGGLPLYLSGVPVGGVGVEIDGIYAADPIVIDIDQNLEERVATAGTRGFEAPLDRRADRIAVLGKFLRFADDENSLSVPVSGLVGSVPSGGSLLAIAGFSNAAVIAGATLLSPASGIVSTTQFGEPAEVLVDSGGAPFPAANPRDSTAPAPGAGGLVADEVNILLSEALRVASLARAQIRRPAGSSARVNIAVVDLDGEVLGFARSPDAPIFGIDVSLQKARTAAFFSSATAAADLQAHPDLSSYVTELRTFLGDPTALENGIAFSDRAGGNLSRPFFPDGINGNPPGPFSKPISEFSPFNTGLQLDLVKQGLLDSLADPMLEQCTPTMPPTLSELANGIQIFPGSVPIFKGGALVGGIGISGDGVDQDDLVAFLGLDNAGGLTGTISNAPTGVRADTISVAGVQLRFVSCPPSPFLDSTAQNVCDGL